MKLAILELAIVLFVMIPLAALIGAGVWYAFGPGLLGLVIVSVLMAAGVVCLAVILDDLRKRA